jgi:dihydrolipoamide dehydrogenase
MVMGELTQETQVAIIGAGPGGYAAAFRAADLGLEVAMIDTEPRPGGVCLHRGCIPSKALLYVNELLWDARHAAALGVTFAEPAIDLAALRAWKSSVVDKLANGLVSLANRRQVQLIRARAVFESSTSLRLTGSELTHLRFQHAILASGSVPVPFPGTEFQPGGRIMDSSGALELADIPKRLLVIGGGYVGVEMGSVYAALGSRVTVVEREEGLLPGADRDLVNIVSRRLSATFEAIHLKSGVKTLTETGDRVEVELDGDVQEPHQSFDRVLVAVGRRPNSSDLGLETTQVKINERGFVIVDDRMRTADERIYAVGDIVGGAMLAHKAIYEGRIAAEVLAGQPSAADARAVPAVVYTDPQLAWCGLTEDGARARGVPNAVTRFPWAASGRALTLGGQEGLTKIVFEPDTQRILGVGIVGRGAGELIAEGVLAVEMGALAPDLAMTMHPHPTLSETEEEAAEAFLGSATHILTRKK